jgi:GT2 family glycosyltransferase
MVNKTGNEIILSFVIVNYNLAVEIENCLNSIFTVIADLSFEVIIVDNNSPDKKIYETQKKFKKKNIHFYFLDENIGFGKGCNFGFSKTNGKYVCFLNPDTIISDPIFLPIIDLFEKDNTIGIIGPRQMLRKKIFDFSAGFYPNIFFELFNLFWIGTFLEALIVFLYTKVKTGKYFELDWILGAAIFIRADLFKQIDGFDKEYFMFFEEVDLCKRVSENGFKIIYYPKLKINHIGSVSGKRDYTLFTKRIYTSKFLYISKHYRPFYKSFMNFLLTLQIISQIILWTLWFPINRQKSSQKLSGFTYLLKNRFQLIQ